MGSVSGTVSTWDGRNISFGSASLTDLSGNYLQSASVSPIDGTYTITQVPAGTYRLDFSDPGYATVWYGGTVFSPESTTVQVGAGQQVVGVDATLAQPGTISGTALYYSRLYYNPGTGYPQTVLATAWAKDPVSGQTFSLGMAAAPDPRTGAYTIRDLPPVTYTVQFSSESQGLQTPYPFVSGYWNGAPNRSGATPVTVAAGQAVTGINGTLTDASPLRIPHDYSGDGHPDLLAVNGAGGLLSYMSNGNAGWNTPQMAVVGSGWNGMRSIIAAGDFDGDGHPDILGLDTTGRLWLYPGDGHNGWLPRRLVATGWQGMTAITDFGDFYGSGTNDLAVRDASGALWIFRGDGSGGLQPNPRKVGFGWNVMTAMIGGTDFDGDGYPDILARDTSGVLWVYPEKDGFWGQRFAIGSGWNVMTSVASVGTLTPDNTASVLARDSTGTLWLYSYTTATKTWAPRKQIGSGWSGMTWIG